MACYTLFSILFFLIKLHCCTLHTIPVLVNWRLHCCYLQWNLSWTAIPYWKQKCGLSRQVHGLCGDRFILISNWNVGPSAKNEWFVKTCGLSWQLSLKRGFTTAVCQGLLSCTGHEAAMPDHICICIIALVLRKPPFCNHAVGEWMQQ